MGESSSLLANPEAGWETSSVNPPKVDLRNLTPRQRLDLLGEIWDSLTADPDQLVLTEAQRVELDRRLDELDQDTVRGIPWDEVLEKIRKRAG